MKLWSVRTAVVFGNENCASHYYRLGYISQIIYGLGDATSLIGRLGGGGEGWG